MKIYKLKGNSLNMQSGHGFKELVGLVGLAGLSDCTLHLTMHIAFYYKNCTLQNAHCKLLVASCRVSKLQRCKVVKMQTCKDAKLLISC